MSVDSAVHPQLHDDAFARDPFPAWERLRHDAPLFHDTIADVYMLTRYAVPVPPLRMHQYHLTVPSLRVTLTEGGSP